MKSPPQEALLDSVDAAMRALLTSAERVAERRELPVRIHGELGSGKEVLARFIHEHTPGASDGPFITFACAGLSEEALRVGLFGAEARACEGATPGAVEQAAGGTLYLEDIGELPMRLQLELLLVLKTNRFRRLAGARDLPLDARLIAGSVHDLTQAARVGSFRADLFHRLDVFRLAIPPLRSRRDDILPLARWFIEQFSRQWVRPPTQLTREAEELLAAYEYPGNIRELRNMVESALIAERGDRLGPSSLSLGTAATRDDAFFAIYLDRGDTPPTMAEIERLYLERVLKYAKGNRSEVSRILGISYPTVARKLADI